MTGLGGAKDQTGPDGLAGMEIKMALWKFESISIDAANQHGHIPANCRRSVAPVATTMADEVLMLASLDWVQTIGIDGVGLLGVRRNGEATTLRGMRDDQFVDISANRESLVAFMRSVTKIEIA